MSGGRGAFAIKSPNPSSFCSTMPKFVHWVAQVPCHLQATDP
jgi:hypothetical protein